MRAVRLICQTIVTGLALHCALAWAGDPGYYVVTVYDDPGKKTLDLRYWTTAPRGGLRTQWPEIGLGWNVNGPWYTEVLASYIGAADYGTRLSSLNWQNDLLLTHGQYPFDLAVHTLLFLPQEEGEAKSLEFGPALQTDIGRTQVNANLFFERSFGSHKSQPTQLKYQWQLRYRWVRGLHVGAQGFGELGTWDNWSPNRFQSHRAGPALFGSIPAGPGVIGWQAAYLWGKTYSQPGRMLTVRMKYDF